MRKKPKTTNLINSIVWKKPARTSTTLNSADNLTVYRHDTAIFHSYLSVTHCPLIHQRALKRKRLPWVFISRLGRLASHISHDNSLRERGKSKNIALKTNSVHKKKNNKLHFHQRTQFVRNKSQRSEQSSFRPKCKRTWSWIDAHLADLCETIVYVISNYPNDCADIHCGVGFKCVCQGEGVGRTGVCWKPRRSLWVMACQRSTPVSDGVKAQVAPAGPSASTWCSSGHACPVRWCFSTPSSICRTLLPSLSLFSICSFYHLNSWTVLVSMQHAWVNLKYESPRLSLSLLVTL